MGIIGNNAGRENNGYKKGGNTKKGLSQRNDNAYIYSAALEHSAGRPCFNKKYVPSESLGFSASKNKATSYIEPETG